MKSIIIGAVAVLGLSALGLTLALAIPDDPDPGSQAVAAESPTSLEHVVASYEPRDVSGMDFFSGSPGGGAAYSGGPAATVEEVLEEGLELAGASPAHLVVRGTASASSVRCEWRGIARTPGQREDAIRFWLGLDANAAIPDKAFLEALFTASFDVIDPYFRETAKANFLAIAEGGLSEEYLFLACYADYVPSEYLLGAGPASPSTLTLAYDRRGGGALLRPVPGGARRGHVRQLSPHGRGRVPGAPGRDGAGC